jgi:hypothetical protein
MQRAIAIMRIALRILPTPKYIRNKKNVVAIVATSPRRPFAKIREKVKRRQKKIKIKKRGTMPNAAGSTK